MGKLFGEVDIVERTIITPEGAVKKVYRLSARTTSGVLFSVDVDEEELESKKVEGVLAKKAAEIELIKKL